QRNPRGLGLVHVRRLRHDDYVGHVAVAGGFRGVRRNGRENQRTIGDEGREARQPRQQRDDDTRQRDRGGQQDPKVLCTHVNRQLSTPNLRTPPTTTNQPPTTH